MHRREPSAASPICTRAVDASEPDVLVTHLAIERAGNYTSSAVPQACEQRASDTLSEMIAALAAA